MVVLSVIMNMMMAGLLLATLIYCLKLNSRIKLLQDGRSELAQVIREFDESTQRAMLNINEIHAATTRISENIQHKIDKASYLADDLEIMLERASKLPGKAEAVIAPRAAQAPDTVSTSIRRSIADIMPSRSQEAPAATKAAQAKASASEAPATPRRGTRGRSRAEQDLMNLVGSKQGSEGSR